MIYHVGFLDSLLFGILNSLNGQYCKLIFYNKFEIVYKTRKCKKNFEPPFILCYMIKLKRFKVTFECTRESPKNLFWKFKLGHGNGDKQHFHFTSTFFDQLSMNCALHQKLLIVIYVFHMRQKNTKVILK